MVGETDLEPVAAHPPLQLVRRPFRDHDAVVDDRDPVREPVGLVEVLGGQEHGRPAADERVERVPERDPAAQVEARRRLVEEQDRRARHERRGKIEPAAHAAGIRADEALAVVGELEVLEQLGRALA